MSLQYSFSELLLLTLLMWACRFSPALRQLHDELADLRRQADELETSLRVKYGTRVLTLKIAAKLGPVIHLAAKSENPLLVKDGTASLVGRSGSTRTYLFPVRCSSSGELLIV